jgi:Ca2+/Na+ antiporter
MNQFKKEVLNASTILGFPIIMLMLTAVLSFNYDVTVMFISSIITLAFCCILCFADLDPLGFDFTENKN